MTWVRLDDQFTRHPKVVAVGALGLAMQVAALCYCNEYLTDGFVPRGAVLGLLNLDGIMVSLSTMTADDASPKRIVEDLLAAELWDEAPGGYQIHDYLDYQPSKTEVQAAQQQRQAAGKLGGIARAKRTAKRDAEQPAKRDPSETPSETLSESLETDIPSDSLSEMLSESSSENVARTRTRSVFGSLDTSPPVTERAQENGGGDDQELQQRIHRARHRANRDTDGWTIAACRAAAHRAQDLTRPGEDPLELLIALAADPRTDQPARLATDAGINTARAILADRRRDDANTRHAAAVKAEQAQADRQADASTRQRARAVDKALAQLNDTEQAEAWAHAAKQAREATGLKRPPQPVIDQTLLDLLTKAETA